MKTNKSYLLIAAVLTFLFTLPPTRILAQENIVDRLNKALNLKLPDKYDAEARKFIEKYENISYDFVITFTEQFIVEQMKVDLGINKQDQYLFLLSVCFNELTSEFLYCGEDGNEKRLESCNAVWDKLEQIQNKYSDEFLVYLEQIKAEQQQRIENANRRIEEANKQIEEYERQSAEYNRQSAEYERQSAEYERQSAEYERQSAEYERQSAEYNRQSAEYNRQSAEYNRQSAENRVKINEGLNKALYVYKDIYLSINQIPNDEDLRKLKENLPKLIILCEKYEVDYKKTLTPEMLKFYGIE